MILPIFKQIRGQFIPQRGASQYLFFLESGLRNSPQTRRASEFLLIFFLLLLFFWFPVPPQIINDCPLSVQKWEIPLLQANPFDKPLLGGLCSLLLSMFIYVMLPAPFNFRPLAAFYIFFLLLLIFLQSMLLFHFSSCSWIFPFVPCSFLELAYVTCSFSWFFVLLATGLACVCSLLICLIHGLLLALCVKYGMLPAPGLPLTGVPWLTPLNRIV